MVFNTTFNNISVISWRSDLLVEETGVPGENRRPAASHWQTLLHNVASSTPSLSRIWTCNVSGEGIDCIGSCKSNYHMITTMTTMVPSIWGQKLLHMISVNSDICIYSIFIYRGLLVWWSPQYDEKIQRFFL